MAVPRIWWLAALLPLAGCSAWPERPKLAAFYQEAATVPGYENIRHWSDAKPGEWADWRSSWLRDRQPAGQQSRLRLLAISSGSDRGAFAAGYLGGWTESGARPEFDIVTGVSTGALIAPFAFLGSSQDGTLRQLYTGVETRDIYQLRPLVGLTGGPSFADSRPLQRLIARYFTAATMTRIAAEHRKGRRLLIATTNLDAERGVIWDLGAIAASSAPDRLALSRKILLASASIPGVFPPVLVDVQSSGTRFREMHVDGGTSGSVFGLPPTVVFGELSPASRQVPASMTVLYNGKIEREYEVVQPRALTIVSRALGTLIDESDRTALRAYERFALDNGVQFRLAAIGRDFHANRNKPFDRRYMSALYAYGRAQGLKEVTDRNVP